MILYAYGKEVGIMLLPSLFEKNHGDSLFDDFFNYPSGFRKMQAKMDTNIKDTGNGYLIEVELPGYEKKDVKAEIKDGYLIISAEHKETKEESGEDGKYIRRERYTGNCRRSFYVGEQLSEGDFKAGFENGVLRLEFPKVERSDKKDDKKYISIM